MACNMGEVATVEAWLDSGNHPDDATTFGGTLLVAAAERGGPDMMRMLNCLRLLCQRGRATAPAGVLARLFSGPSLPRELFAHVLSYWRSARALDEDRAFDRVRARYLPARTEGGILMRAPPAWSNCRRFSSSKPKLQTHNTY